MYFTVSCNPWMFRKQFYFFYAYILLHFVFIYKAAVENLTSVELNLEFAKDLQKQFNQFFAEVNSLF